MNDLLVTALTPTLNSGTGLRTYGVVAALARRRAVEVAYVVFDAPRPAPEYGRLDHVSTRPMLPSRGPGRALAYARALRAGVPRDLARGVSPELARAGDPAAPDVRVIADGPVVAGALLALARRREVVYLAHNFESGFRRRGASLTSFERTVLRTFSESWMATHADQREATALAGEHVPTRYVPNVVDVSGIEPIAPRGCARVLFVGDFTYEPNREGLRFLAEQVLPRAWERRPELRLLVAGRGLSGPAADPRIELLGFVEDLRSAYALADVVAVPLLRGGGSPLKFVEALAYGLPVIATPHAAGLLEHGVAGEHFIVAADQLEFAQQLALLVGDPVRGRRLGAGGRELAARCYSIDALARLLSR
ncbi:MAG: glycosyltransferase [Solirubrobacteraceae bacterium]|jgi:glycosyltransferase involved in cell wall biosynthesis